MVKKEVNSAILTRTIGLRRITPRIVGRGASKRSALQRRC